MSDIRAVVFDIGNVLIGWQPEQFYDGAIGRDQRLALFGEVDLFGMNERIDLGADFRQTVYDLADMHPQWSKQIRLWHDNWIEMATPVIEHSVHLLQALRRINVPVFALSNFGVGSLAVAQKHYPFLGTFDRRYISGQLAVMKPDPVIYQTLEDDNDMTPAALLFADDRPENIAAARARGWRAHLFVEPRGWAERLVAEGLLTAHEAGL